MNRLMEKMVLFGLVIAWRLAGLPILRSPPSVKATTDGVVRCPSLLMMTVGWLPSITATHEFVVPRSMPIIFPMILFDLNFSSTPPTAGGTVLSSNIVPKAPLLTNWQGRWHTAGYRDQSSVRKGGMGMPGVFSRLAPIQLRKPYRTATGLGTSAHLT